MSLKIFHNPRCTKSRLTLALLEERGFKPEIVEYLQSPPTKKELEGIVKMLGLRPHDIARKKEASEADIDLSSIDDSSLISAMIENPIVIERPIVVHNGKAAIGRPPENVLEIL